MRTKLNWFYFIFNLFRLGLESILGGNMCEKCPKNLKLVKTDIDSSLSVATTDILAATKQPQQHHIDLKDKDKDRNKPDS